MITERMRELADLSEGKIKLSFDPEDFFGRWFLSNKKSIPKEWFVELAKVYPYKGTALRLDSYPPSKDPYTSWSKTNKGIRSWLQTQNEAGVIPKGGVVVKATIIGIDLVAFIKDQNLKHSSAKLMIGVEEVTPIKKVSGIEVVAIG